MGAPMPVTFAAEVKTESQAFEPAPRGTTTAIPSPPSSFQEALTQPSVRNDKDQERFPPGTLVLRQYRTVRRLGEGGMGSVYLARDDVSGQEVAIKALPAALAREADIRERFVQEARALAALDHHAIVPLVTFASDGNDHFLVMKYVPGKSIEALIEEKGVLEIDVARQIFRTVVEALGYAHDHGVIHRDVKPANVLLSDEGKIFLVDFGISKSEDSTRLTQTGMLMGTPQYMSPEQISGHVIDGRSDLYAAGLLLFEMLTGRPPFTGERTFSILRQHVEAPVPDPRQIRKSEISRDLLVLIDALLKKDPNERPRNAAATLELLDKSADATPPFGESLTFFDEGPLQRSTPLTTSIPSAMQGDEDSDIELALGSRGRGRAALLSLVIGALVLWGAVQFVPGWASGLELEAPPPPPMPRIDPHDEAFTLLLNKAQDHINNDDGRRALAVLDVALTERPDDKTALLLKARALVQRKWTAAAKTTLDELAARSDLTAEDLALIENYRGHLGTSGAAPARTRKRRPAKPPPPAKTAVKAAEEDTAGPLTDQQLRLSAGKTRRAARTCYEAHVLAEQPDAAGLVVLEVQIEPTGSVSKVSTPEHGFAEHPDLIPCLEELARSWTFPAFAGAPIAFRYTYDLRPTL